MSDTPESIHLLLVDDDDDFRGMTARYLRKRGCYVLEAATGEEGLILVAQHSFDVAIVDLQMPGMSGIELLRKMQEESSDAEVIMLTGAATVTTAVNAMKLGACDYLSKPAPLEELMVVIEKAFQSAQIRKENRQLKAIFQRDRPDHHMIGDSAAMREVYRLIERAGPTDKPILIQGESGTGKELVARALHRASHLADKPPVVINCAALPEQLLESELFGHEKGAFTGAATAKPGLFEIADGGTLFIDEIGELAGALQAKLLRVLEDGSMRRVGSVKDCRVKVRLISATNRDLAQEAAQGRFREDLYYRIDVMTLTLPPLRERTGDIPLLVSHFAGPGWEVEPEAMHAMEHYHWPGNVRQLSNAIERAKILADDDEILARNLPPAVLNSQRREPGHRHEGDSGTDLASLQRSHIVEILQQEKGNKVRTARALGVSRRTLYRLLEKYQIDTDSVDES